MAALSLAACGGARFDYGSPRAKTRLTMLVTDLSKGRAAFHLACRPAGGDFPSPAKSCAAVEKHPEIVTKPEPMCVGAIGPIGPGLDVTFSGRIDGKHFHSRISVPCWESRDALPKAGLGDFISREFEKHRLPWRQVSLKGPVEKTFPPGELHPADLITCDVNGKHLELPVPLRGRSFPVTGLRRHWWPVARLEVARHRDGSVTSSCKGMRVPPADRDRLRSFLTQSQGRRRGVPRGDGSAGLASRAPSLMPTHRRRLPSPLPSIRACPGRR